ncbi:CBS domain-containing protein [Tsukamurella tyrosinosolvens]|uniref:CBS domain-containing protein n=1 Tax=Tsukamurella tyrosinosolvens TaxID=57704 RepID=UPI001AF2A917|nr:CBS domain-containing protein [Tsukamurella tyrosinosolvens]QRY84238.1 CBS domain-containing protein [Tsukamurella tyrosinosolvens]
MTTTVGTVDDVMLRRPTVHPADITVRAARAAFAASPKLRLLLLVRDGRLIGTLDRDDVSAPDAEDHGSALALASLDGRTVAPDVPAGKVRTDMVASGIRRLAVVDDHRRLLGLLCLKASTSGFCTDDGVDTMRRCRNPGPERPQPADHIGEHE